jgi:replicative DNA helicase
MSVNRTGNSGDEDPLRVPPSSIEAEQAVLGGLMLEADAFDRVADVLTEQDFYRPEHQLVFRAAQRLALLGQPCDVVTLSEDLVNEGELENAGGHAYLASLARDTPSAANIRSYGEIVRDRAVLRRMIAVGTEIVGNAFEPEGRNARELVDEAERRVLEIAEFGRRGQSGFICLRDLLTSAVDRIDLLYQQDSPITGVATGWDDFDSRTAGLQKGDLVVVAGRPSMGKTTFAMNIAEHAAIKDGVGVAMFSMEMPGEQLAMRMMSSLGRIDQHRVRTGKLEDDDWPRLTSALTLLKDAPIHIDDSAALSPGELRSRARRLKRELPHLGLILVDYLQLMQVPGSSENRTNEISEISRSLKALARELEVPVIALSQLNRSLEQRTNKRPINSDLRESGAIEQDADLIVFIYRDEVYNPDSQDKGVAEIIIGKQRNGPIGTVKLTFLGNYTRFENFAPEHYTEAAYS